MTTKFDRRQMIRLGAGALTVAGVAGTAVGCSSSTSSGSTSGQLKGDLNILVSSAAASDAAFRQVNAAFTKKHPDVKINFTTVPNDSYPASLSSRLTANKVEIFVAQSMSVPPSYAKDSESDSVRLAKAGGMVDLTDQDFMKSFKPSVLDSIKLDQKNYVVPTGLSYTTGLYYNKKIFSQHSLTAPTTWSELKTVCSTLSKKGITPFGIGGKDGWPAGLYMLAAVEGLYPSAQDKEQLAQQIWANKIKLTDSRPVEVLERVGYVYQNAQRNFAGASYDDIPGGFARSKFAMIADGTWNQTIIDKAVNSKFEYGYIPTPMGDKAAGNDHLTGKIELMLGVAAGAKNRDAAIAWLSFFSEQQTYAKFIATAGYSSAQTSGGESDFLKSISQYTKEFRTPWSHYWFANNKAGQDAVYPFNYPAIKPMGSDTPQQAAAAAQKAWAGAS